MNDIPPVRVYCTTCGMIVSKPEPLPITPFPLADTLVGTSVELTLKAPLPLPDIISGRVLKSASASKVISP